MSEYVGIDENLVALETQKTDLKFDRELSNYRNVFSKYVSNSNNLYCSITIDSFIALMAKYGPNRHIHACHE